MAETSSLSSSKSDEEKVEMLDRLLTRLALCDDSNLQALLFKLLPYTISSLSSHSSAVRNKVLEILSHVNKRVKHQPEIGLPLSELWTIYSEANSAPMVRNFCILYVEMAMDRADRKDKENLSPMLLLGVSRLPHQHQEIILRLVVKVIGDCHASGMNGEIAAKYGLLNDSQDRNVFIEFCLHTILYQQSSQRECPPGLSIAQTHRVTARQSLKSEILLTRKAFGERQESYGVLAVGIIYAFIYFLGFSGLNGTEKRGSGRALGLSALLILTVVTLYFNDSAVIK